MNDLQQRVETKYNEYLSDKKQSPLYALVGVQFKGEDLHEDFIIKLVSDYNETTPEWEDEQIFYYCNGIEELKELCDEDNGEDFFVTDFFLYMSEEDFYVRDLYSYINEL